MRALERRSPGHPRTALARVAAAARRSLVAGLVVFLAAGLLLVADPSPALACDCAPPPPPGQALEEADAVFVGVVTDTRLEGREVDGDLLARIEVAEVYGGDVTEVVEVSTAATGAMCGYGFEAGTEVLVYASQRDDGSFSTNLCTRTTALDRAQEDLQALGEGSAPQAGERPRDAGSIWGSADGLVPAVGTVIVLVVVLGVVLLRRRIRRLATPARRG